jgi:protein-disulfide isomerase
LLIKFRIRPPGLKNILTGVIVLGCVSFIHVARYHLRETTRNSRNEAGEARSLGDPGALFKIVGFSDFQCRYCREGAVILGQYINRYPDRIYFDQHYFPMGTMHRHAYRSAYFAHCAAQQGHFWEFSEELFNKQDSWGQMSVPEADEAFFQMAFFMRLDVDQMRSCVDSRETRTVILNDRAFGEALGVRSTPTYFINGIRIAGPDSLEKMLEKFVGEDGS